MRSIRLSLCVALVSAVAAVVTAPAGAAPPGHLPRRPPSIPASRPSPGRAVTANFVFFDSGSVYIGQAAHCSGTGGSTATDGCTTESLPVGTAVQVDGASRPA